MILMTFKVSIGIKGRPIYINLYRNNYVKILTQQIFDILEYLNNKSE